MIIDNAGLSLTEPAGLFPSSLARMTLPRRSLSAPGIRTRRTSGVFPTKSCRVLYIAMQPLDILGNTFLDGCHRRVVASRTKLAQISMSEGLIFALQRLGESDVLEQTLRPQLFQRERCFILCLTAAVDRSDCHVVETLRPAGTQVEDTGLLGVVEEKQVDLGDITHEHKIPLLTAVFITVRTFEQLDLAVGTELVEVMKGHRSHPSLVRFTRAVDIEVTKTDDL